MKNIIRRIPHFETLKRYKIIYKHKLFDYLFGDKIMIKKRYKKRFKKDLEFNNIKNWNEKILWRMIYDRNPIYTELSDKIKVRNYIKQKIGDKYLTKLYKVFEKSSEINFEDLPEKFIIKCNHDCGSSKLINKSEKIDIKKIKKFYKSKMKINLYLTNYEWHYKNISPRILVEEVLENLDGSELVDYKFHCFNGRIELIQVANSNHTGNNIYDKNFNLLDINYYTPNYSNIEKPKNLNEMLSIAQELSKGYSYIRVDLYSLSDGRIKFGELTFTPGAGMLNWKPEEWNIKMLKCWEESECFLLKK